MIFMYHKIHNCQIIHLLVKLSWAKRISSLRQSSVEQGIKGPVEAVYGHVFLCMEIIGDYLYSFRGTGTSTLQKYH